MASEEGLRERKKRQTAQRIEAAALDLFERDGFEATTVEAIAAAADISPRTFFHYFATKDDVVLADYADRLARVTDVLREQPSGTSPWRALTTSFRAVAADYEHERMTLLRRFRIMASTESVFARSLQLQAGWEDAVTSVLDSHVGGAGRQHPTRLLATSAVAAMRAAMHDWIAGGAADSLPDLVQQYFDHLSDGLDRRLR